MAVLSRLVVTAAAVVIVGVALLALAAGFICAAIYAARWMGLTHALGMDTQSSPNYAFSSGVGPMVIASLGFSGVGVTLLRHINCEKHGCWRLGHRHPGHGRPICRMHYHCDVVPTKP